MNHWPHQSDVDAFYGNPRGNALEGNPTWEAANLVRVAPPWALVTAWDFAPITHGVRIHKRCQESLAKVFEAIWNSAAHEQRKINEWGMNLYSGAYNFRMMHGGTNLSMHSWGCAIDFDSARNSFGDSTPNFVNIPAVRDAFAAEQWLWGGTWHKPDGMHFQAARL